MLNPSIQALRFNAFNIVHFTALCVLYALFARTSPETWVSNAEGIAAGVLVSWLFKFHDDRGIAISIGLWLTKFFAMLLLVLATEWLAFTLKGLW